MNPLASMDLSPVVGLKIMLDGANAQTVEGKRRAWAIAEEREQQIEDEMQSLKTDKKNLVQKEAALKSANDHLVRENKRHKNHITALTIDNMMLRQENDHHKDGMLAYRVKAQDLQAENLRLKKQLDKLKQQLGA